MSKAVIKLFGMDVKDLDSVCEDIKGIAKKSGVKLSGPVPLPNKRMRVPVRKTPCGSGRESYETWEMRIHKRLIDLQVNEKALRHIMRINVPKGVNIEMEIVE